MKRYESASIRNVAVIGHGGSGKTTLVSAMAHLAGSTSRIGSVAEGTALTDFTPDEVAHRISINAALAWAEWMDTKLNLLDTPGYLDFAGDVKAALHVADAALVVVGASSGVEVGTERVWEYAKAQGLPAIFFVSMMDKEHADFRRAYEQIRSSLTPRVIPVEVPIGAGPGFRGIVNLFSDRAHIYKPGTRSGERTEEDIPGEVADEVEGYRQTLMETIAETDDSLIERYLSGEAFGRDEVLAAMKRGMASGDVVPLFCGSAEKTFGLRQLLTKLVELVPTPLEGKPRVGTRPGGEDRIFVDRRADGALVAQVFKTTTEPHVGELSYFRIWAGALESGHDYTNSTRDRDERLAHVSVMQGRDRTEVPRLEAGDIGVVAKLKNTHTGDTLVARGAGVVLPSIDFPQPVISAAIVPHKPGEEDKIGHGLSRLHEEDPTFTHEFNPELGQTIVRGLGELHLQILLERLHRQFGVGADMAQPRVAYRETLRRRAEAQGKYKKQTGGRGQYGDAWVRVEPLPRGQGYEFVDRIVGGVIPNKFIPAVDKGIQEALHRGVIAGFPFVDVRVELFDGSYHNVDSSEMAFKIAGSMAFQDAVRKASPYLLEPIMEVTATVPEEYMGEVIGDLNSRRGRILGMEQNGHKQVIRATVPRAELYRYSTALRAITHGRGDHARSFLGYEEIPKEIAARIVEEQEGWQGEARH
ncbi:MAG: elongation factor G [Gemmatimonadetes bacterium]|nr:elongation factor G [Gemmatimonadota bacterium]